jgi:hypothetical protein
MQRRPRTKDNGHLDFIRGLPCCICGDNTSTEAAHIRMGDPSIAKPITGIAIKPDDKFVLPLCGKHHRKQHEMNEWQFWLQEKAGQVDPVKVALALYAVSGDHELGERIALANV